MPVTYIPKGLPSQNQSSHNSFFETQMPPDDLTAAKQQKYPLSVIFSFVPHLPNYYSHVKKSMHAFILLASGKNILTRYSICASSQQKDSRQRRFYHTHFQWCQNERKRQDPMRLETLIDITSLWLRRAVRKQEILLIFNTSHHVASHARSRKRS